MAILLLRHAKAGDRNSGDSDDGLRPLSKPGRRQADGLVETLKTFRVARILSSPHRRCVQTVEPLARARGLDVELTDVLAEGAGGRDAILLMRELEDDVVMCSHGDVILSVVHGLSRRYLDTPKGGGWVIEVGDSGPRVIRALAAPSGSAEE